MMEGWELRYLGACDEAIQEIMAANLPPRCAVLKHNSSEATVSCWYHDLKISLLVSEVLEAGASEFSEPFPGAWGRKIKPREKLIGIDSDTGIRANKHY
jgi:hypothetical protein